MNLPEKGRYGVGMLFFSNNDKERNEIEAHLNAFIEQEGQTSLAGEHVPVDVSKNRRSRKRDMSDRFAKYLSGQVKIFKMI